MLSKNYEGKVGERVLLDRKGRESLMWRSTIFET